MSNTEDGENDLWQLRRLINQHEQLKSAMNQGLESGEDPERLLSGFHVHQHSLPHFGSVYMLGLMSGRYFHSSLF